MKLDELRDLLIANGFIARKSPINDRLNECDWYLFRQTKTQVLCECNDRPPPLTVLPYRYTRDERHETATVEIAGERGDVWYKFQAYGISIDELVNRFEEIERRLVAAWEAAQ